MRHDIDYRIVLRSKQEYLYKYKFSAFLLITIYAGGVAFTKRSSKSKDKNLKNELDKFRNHNEENERNKNFIKNKLVKIHENFGAG